MLLSNAIKLNPARLAAAQAQKDVMTRKEAAAYLNISPQTLSKYTRAGDIPCVKLARRVLYSRRALEQWAAGETAPKQDAGTPLTTAAAGDVQREGGNDENV